MFDCGIAYSQRCGGDLGTRTVFDLHGAGVDDGGIGGILLASILTRLRVWIDSSLMKFLCSVAYLGSVGVTLVKG